jgi:hypothetical protein
MWRPMVGKGILCHQSGSMKDGGKFSGSFLAPWSRRLTSTRSL